MDCGEDPPPSKKMKLMIDAAALITFLRVTERLPRRVTCVSDVLGCLVETASMGELEKLVSTTNTETVLVCGPHGIGKSTALLWLYCKLQDKGGYNVLTLTFGTLETAIEEIGNTSSNNRIVALIELNGILRVTENQVDQFSIFVSKVRTLGGIAVLGSSSGFDAIGLSAVDRPGKKLVNRILLYHGLETLEMRCSEEEAKEIALLYFPGCEKDSENYHKILEIANYNPGYIACYKPTQSIDRYNQRVQRDVLVEWQEIVNQVALSYSLKRTRQILLCSYYDVSITTTFNLHVADVANELPITTYLFRIDEHSIPKPNLKLSSESVFDMIRFVSNQLISLSPQTGSNSAIGHLFEIPAINHLAEGIELDCAAFEERDTTGEDMGASTRRGVNRKTLVCKPSQNTPCLHFMGTYDGNNSTPQVGQLYKCKENEMGIDAFAMLENEVLLLIQISIQQERHHQKVEHSLQRLPRFALEIKKKQITYLYLNPNCSIPATELYNNFHWIVSRYAEWEWLFASLNSQRFLSVKLDILKNMLML